VFVFLTTRRKFSIFGLYFGQVNTFMTTDMSVSALVFKNTTSSSPKITFVTVNRAAYFTGIVTWLANWWTPKNNKKTEWSIILKETENKFLKNNSSKLKFSIMPWSSQDIHVLSCTIWCTVTIIRVTVYIWNDDVKMRNLIILNLIILFCQFNFSRKLKEKICEPIKSDYFCYRSTFISK